MVTCGVGGGGGGRSHVIFGVWKAAKVCSALPMYTGVGDGAVGTWHSQGTIIPLKSIGFNPRKVERRAEIAITIALMMAISIFFEMTGKKGWREV